MSLDYGQITVPRLGGGKMVDDEKNENKKVDEEITTFKGDDVDLVEIMLDNVVDPELKSMLTAWLTQRTQKDEDGEENKDEDDQPIMASDTGEIGETGITEPVATNPVVEDISEAVEEALTESDVGEKVVEAIADEIASEAAEIIPIQASIRSPISKSSEEKRIVYGVVSEPDTVDLQGDILTAEEIAKACHAFMIKSQTIGIEHTMPARARIIESYIAPTDFECGGRLVKKGSWVMGVKILDDALWQAIRRGEITGFSIGGTGKRIPAY